MIRKTLARTKAATFCIHLPSEKLQGMPCPTGTGFFVSRDGWFVTAAHVVGEDGKPRVDSTQWTLHKEFHMDPPDIGEQLQFVTLEHFDAADDFALLRVDWTRNASKEWLNGRTEFPWLPVSSRILEEGEPVYSFGYPLGHAAAASTPIGTVRLVTLHQRTASTIVSSRMEASTPVMGGELMTYVLDKALNYGSSGGPIVATDTGYVHAFCSRFQPV